MRLLWIAAGRGDAVAVDRRAARARRRASCCFARRGAVVACGAGERGARRRPRAPMTSALRARSCATSRSASARRTIIRGVSLDVASRRAPRDHRPQRRRQVDAVQPDQRPLRAHEGIDPARTARRSPARRRIAINRRGLARSFQVTNIFPRLSVFENIRCSVLWSLGYRYNFWRRVDTLRDAERAAERDAGADRHARAARHAGRRADVRRAARARDRHHDRRRRERHPARRAHRRHEPQRGRSRGRADPLGLAGAHAA